MREVSLWLHCYTEITLSLHLPTASKRRERGLSGSVCIGSCNGEYRSKVLNSMIDTFETKHEAETFGLQMGEGMDRQREAQLSVERDKIELLLVYNGFSEARVIGHTT